MPSKIEIHPGAVKEARKAYRWYLRRSSTAARRFQVALETALEQMAQFPDRWPVYWHGTRYLCLRRFPYLLVYRLKGERLQVVALAHGRQKPGYWKKRKFFED